MNTATKSLLALAAVIAIGAGLFFVLHKPQVNPMPAPAPASMAPAAPVPVAPAPSASAKPDCLLPGPPPVPPNGATATAADMALGHATIQNFVNELENYQACRNNQLDHADASVSDKQKQAWLDQGNAAVDEANAIANAFTAQLKIFKARPPAKP
jgi:hypothetical protein